MIDPIRAIVLVFGAWIVLKAISDAVFTIVVPRRTVGSSARHAFLLTRMVFEARMLFSRNYTQRDRIMAGFAPFALLAMEAVWLLEIGTGFCAIYWGIGAPSVNDAALLSGSSLFTLGYTQAFSHAASALSFCEAATGLLMVALLISYLPTMYAAFSRREAFVTLLDSRAGTPPSAIALLIRLHQDGRLEDGTLWARWEEWFVDVEETHCSLSALVFFRSPHPRRSWVTSAGAIMDAGLLLMSSVEGTHPTEAAYCVRGGERALAEIVASFRLPDKTYEEADRYGIERAQFEEALDRLREAGLNIRGDRDAAWAAFIERRVRYQRSLMVLARIAMAPQAVWCGSGETTLPLLPRFWNDRKKHSDQPRFKEESASHGVEKIVDKIQGATRA